MRSRPVRGIGPTRCRLSKFFEINRVCFGDGTGGFPSSSDVSADTNASSEVSLGLATSGTITIIKDPVPDLGPDFAFTTTGVLAPTNFSLDDNAYGTLANTRTFVALTAVSYPVTEAAAASCRTTVACVDPDGTLPTMQTFTNFAFNTDTVTETVVAHFTPTIDLGSGKTVADVYGYGRPVSYLTDVVILITALSQTQLAPAALGPVAALFSPAEAQARASFLVVHSLTVTNLDPGIAPNGSVTSPLPMDLTFASNTGAYTIPFPCALGSLAAEHCRVITTTFSKLPGFDPCLPIMLTATVTSATPDPDPANDTNSLVIAWLSIMA